MKENKKKKELNAIKRTCIFKALETYHQSNKDQTMKSRKECDSGYFDSDSADSSENNENTVCFKGKNL